MVVANGPLSTKWLGGQWSINLISIEKLLICSFVAGMLVGILLMGMLWCAAEGGKKKKELLRKLADAKQDDKTEQELQTAKKIFKMSDDEKEQWKQDYKESVEEVREMHAKA